MAFNACDMQHITMLFLFPCILPPRFHPTAPVASLNLSRSPLSRYFTMDPLSVIAVTGAIAHLIELASQTIQRIEEFDDDLHSDDSSLSLRDLQASLSALKVTLSKIYKWLEAPSTPGGVKTTRRLVIDIDLSVPNCKMMLENTVAHLTEMREKDGRFDIGPRTPAVSTTDMTKLDDLRKTFEQQTTTLALLLTASLSYLFHIPHSPFPIFTSLTTSSDSPSSQTQGLQIHSSRQILLQTQSDTSPLSLHALDDTASYLTGCVTNNTSTTSLIPHIDTEAIRSRLYTRYMRDPFRVLLRGRCGSERRAEVPRAKFMYDEIICRKPIPYRLHIGCGLVVASKRLHSATLEEYTGYYFPHIYMMSLMGSFDKVGIVFTRPEVSVTSTDPRYLHHIRNHQITSRHHITTSISKAHKTSLKFLYGSIKVSIQQARASRTQTEQIKRIQAQAGTNKTK
ncbi:uncharacterized protein BDR25DRAFT_355592 [Lindgomyces ingoldianus]|uniref:Uncharacterized protein n=1 Tax=Lindgomyces ingoldianus TaxID=673940 RepID=A0ACB6QWC7_9PLEO|nr:uncharacterized protein BDR25DRAFT_355592 [Lindgomyces ingoldianus]KAF2470496.1 hypothetical protein BDR25DRAFT_355592 [Lindgomyces ingoldianus]